MSKIVKEVKLICSEIGDNANKYWYGRVYENGDFESEWGRVGVTKDSKLFPGGGERMLEKKVKEKNKKGYSELKVAATTPGVSTKSISDNNLSSIAKSQIQTDSPELDKLIDRLVKANVHKITSSTQLTYNDATGLFSTPLGIVTPDAINDARDLLVKIKPIVEKQDYKDKELAKHTNLYLRLIPQNVGMKLRIESVFPDVTAVQKQSDILDSLEASFQALQTQPAQKTDSKVSAEKVFDVKLGILDPKSKEYKKYSDFFYKTRQTCHGYDHIKIKNIYSVCIAEMDAAFESNLTPIQEVFHGSSQANILSILKSGLKVSPPSTAYIAGKMWGNGIYGAINSSKSLGYTLGRWGGSSGESGWLFVCDFGLGKIEYPSTYSSTFPKKGYDSVWAEAKRTSLRFDEVIVFRNSQVKIKALIEVK
jgi:poly [ADP-ribose] polymerase